MITRHVNNRSRRAARTRASLLTTGRNFRLSVNRSNKYMSVQILDLKTGRTVTGVVRKSPEEAGKMIAEAAKKAKISEVVFDRGAYKYHGRVKLLADAAKEAGLKF